jgi:hypothetical protein
MRLRSSNDGNAVVKVSLKASVYGSGCLVGGSFGFPPSNSGLSPNSAKRRGRIQYWIDYLNTELMIADYKYLSQVELACRSAESLLQSILIGTPRRSDVNENQSHQPFCNSILLLTNLERKSNAFSYRFQKREGSAPWRYHRP